MLGVLGAVVGGVGLFLLGMALLTEGLQVAAGDRLRDALRRYTATRWSSVLTGAVATAVLQSSTVVTLLTIGFVGAGLLSLTSALGVVFGANVGTTLTAWMVAGVGLKLHVSTIALPLVGVGALWRLFAQGKRAALGSALAGFGLLFVGIDVLQEAMAGAAQHIDFGRYAGRGPWTLLLLTVIGTIMTVVMQSSTAAVATTLAAVQSGTIGLVQAAALVIGQNVGTTATAVIGSIGGSAPVRRIALAHVVFNVVTAIVALAALPFLWDVAEERLARREPALVISAFHTAFNLLGVMIFLPFTQRLADWLERAVMEHGARLTYRLATGRGASAAAVLEACRLTAHDIAGAALDAAVSLLTGEAAEDELAAESQAIEGALDALRDKLRAVRESPDATDVHQRHVATLHALDHLYRLEEALRERGHAALRRRHRVMEAPARDLARHFRALAAWTREREGAAPDSAAVSRALADVRRQERPRILERTAAGDLDPEEGERLLEAMRWIDRLGYHSARAHHHLELADSGQPPARATDPRGDESYDATA